MGLSCRAETVLLVFKAHPELQFSQDDAKAWVTFLSAFNATAALLWDAEKIDSAFKELLDEGLIATYGAVKGLVLEKESEDHEDSFMEVEDPIMFYHYVVPKE